MNTKDKQSFCVLLVCLDMDVEIIILSAGNINCYDLESKKKNCVCADPMYEELVKPMSSTQTHTGKLLYTGVLCLIFQHSVMERWRERSLKINDLQCRQ